MDVTFTLEVTGDENLLDAAIPTLILAAEKVRADIPSLEKTAIVFHGDGILDTF
jgi:hypothetical protein